MQDFIQIRQKNVLVSPSGDYGKFREMLWELYNDRVVNVDYRLKKKFTNNYIIKITTDNG